MTGRCACGCGHRLSGRERKWVRGHAPSPFDPSHKPYGTYDGAPGSPEQWRHVFEQRFSAAQVTEYLGDRSPWEVLGIRAGATLEEIKTAYRRRARETHPDLNPGIDRAVFQRVQAAYQKLTDN
jgi:hypothetical protein